MNIASIYQPVREGLDLVEERLRQLSHTDSESLNGLLCHVLNQGGKRLRPAVTLLVGKTYKTDPGVLIPMATAVELFHTATLVHDDTVDASSLRRGRPTVNNLYGGAKAVLFGDYLFAVAAELASTTGNLGVVTLFAQTLSTVSASELSQSFRNFDLSQSRQLYYNNIASKTASLFVLATQSAALLSNAKDEIVTACREYGYNLGMAYQIVDDILDFVGAEEDLGKPVGADLIRGVVTLPVILTIERNPGDERVLALLDGRAEDGVRALIEMASGQAMIQESYRIAAEFCQKALDSAKKLPDGQARQSLLDLTKYVTARKS
ncbi:MAG: polyprenyl synthetase family protein [Dehalococcoidia bacterium]|nr:polyprenyl synthetase family protein [Dehalococcoidia bacterium]